MEFNESTFRDALHETIAWSASKISLDDPRWCLRSPELRPPHDYDDDNPGLFNDPKYITHVTDTRSKLIDANPTSHRQLEHSGRLLLVDYNATNHNEATEDESSGFFDWADNPPWDLWVGDFGDKLICWIPKQFVDVVQRSMAVECMGMLLWIDQNDEEFNYPDWLVRMSIGG